MFGNLLNSQDLRAESAQELYKQAATNYKLAQEWSKASNAFIQCVSCDKLCNGGDTAELLIEAGNMIKKVNTAEGIQLLN